MTIRGGKFEPVSHTVEVSGNCIIEENGKPAFYYNDDLLIVHGDITWQNGSIGDALFDGEIQIYGDWVFENGTQADIDEDHTIRFVGSSTSEINIDDPVASFGNIEVSRKVMYTFASDYSLKCNGNVSIAEDGELVIWSELLDTEGNMLIEQGGLIELKGTGSMEVAGEASIYGSFWVRDGSVVIESASTIHPTGTLLIENGSYIVSYPYNVVHDMNGSLNISGDGLFELTFGSLYIGEEANCFIDDGMIRVGKTFNASFEDTFQPDGGTVELTEGISGGQLICNIQNLFRNLVINDDIDMMTDIRAGNVTIESGSLDIGSHKLTVYGDIINEAELKMTDFQSNIECFNTIYWNAGSGGDITDGIIHTEDIVFESGTTASFGTGHTTFVTNDIVSNEDNAAFGNLVVEPAAKASSKAGKGMTPIRVDGNCTFTDGTARIIEEDWYVQGILDIVDGASVSIVGDHTMHTYSDFDLMGTLDLGTEGNTYVEGDFDILYTGDLVMDGGEFTVVSDVWTAILGSLTMTDGVMELQTSLSVESSANINLTGGSIRLENTFEATEPNTFQPAGGTVDFYGPAPSYIQCNNGNFFYNLSVSKTSSQSAYPGENMVILNNLTIEDGIFKSSYPDNPIEIEIGGNVEINDGGLFLVNESSQVTLADGSHLNVNDGGTLQFYGDVDNNARLTSISGYYYVDVWSGGTLAAEYTTFEKMTADGIKFHPGSIIDPAHPFNQCTFQGGAPSGTMLTINNNQTLTIDDVSFFSDGQEIYNVTKTVDHGSISFMESNGDFAGSEYENDPHDRIHWLVPELSVDPGSFDFQARYSTDYLTVYSNTSYSISDDMDWVILDYFAPIGTQVVEIYVWTNNTGMVRSGEITVETEDGSIEIVIPVTQQPFVEHIVSLPAGWSGLSSYIKPVPSSVVDVFSGITDELIIALTEDGIYYPEYGVNSIAFWQDFSAYKVKTNTAVDFTIHGIPYPDKTMTIPEGWSLLPVTSECTVDVETLFGTSASSLEIIKDVAGYGIYWPDMGINTLGTLDPGKAYYILTTNTFSVTFDDCSKSSKNIPPEQESKIEEKLAALSPWQLSIPTPSSHSLAISADALSGFETGGLIGAFDESGLCRGISVVDGGSICLNVFGDDPFSFEKDGFEEGDKIFFKLYNLASKEEVELIPVYDFNLPNANGTFFENGLSLITGFKLNTAGFAGIPDPLIHVYPNPTTGICYISGLSSNDRVSLTDIQGQLVMTKQEKMPAFWKFDLSHCKPGIYMIAVEQQNTVTYHKLILK